MFFKPNEEIGFNKSIQFNGMSERTFLTKVIPVFGASLGVSALGVYSGLQALSLGVPILALLGLSIFELALVFTADSWKNLKTWNKFLFFVYALLSGVTLVPLLTFAGAKGGLLLITQALLVTFVTFVSLALYGLFSGKDFSSLGGVITFGAIVSIIVALLNFFIFNSGALVLITSVFSVGVFSAFIVYETSIIKNLYSDDDYICAALGLLIAFTGMFQSILQVFSLTSNSEDAPL